jgi:hypothetical protein
MSKVAEDQFFVNEPPAVPTSGANSLFQVQNQTTSAAAAAFDWTAALVVAAIRPELKGRVHLAIEAGTTDVFVRFGPTSTTATSSANGRLIKAGSPAVTFYVDPTSHKFCDFIAPGGAGTIKFQVASPPSPRNII